MARRNLGRDSHGEGDGTSGRFGPGDILRITDITGRGHKSWWEDDPVYAVMPLPDDA